MVIKASERKKINDFIYRLTRMHSEAHALGLHRTGHDLHRAVQTVGWELEEKITGKRRDVPAAVAEGRP